MLQFEQEHDTPASGSADWVPGPDWGSVLADNWQPRAIALVGSLNLVPRGSSAASGAFQSSSAKRT